MSDLNSNPPTNAGTITSPPSAPGFVSGSGAGSGSLSSLGSASTWGAPTGFGPELLELASLDALALLDEQDAALFERSFLASTPADQRQIREFQAQVATDPVFLASSEPSDALRLRVLSHVTGQMRRSAAELAPVSLIRSGAHAAPARGGWRAPLFWQAASFALLAGLVTSIVFYHKAVRETDLLVRNIGAIRISDKVREAIGAEPWAVMHRAEFKTTLDSPDHSAAGLLCVDSRSKLLVLVAYGVPSDADRPELHIKGADGTLIVVELRSAGEGILNGSATLAKIDTEMLRGAAITIVDRSGRELLAA